MSLSVATLRTTCTHSLLHSSYDPADPALPHPFIYRSPSPLPPIPFPRWSRISPASPCPGLSILSRRTAYGVTHKLRLPLQTPTECCYKGPTRPVSETVDATLREKREMQTLDHVGGTHVCNAIFHSSGLENPTPFRTIHPTCNRPTPVCRPAPAAAHVCLALTSCPTS